MDIWGGEANNEDRGEIYYTCNAYVVRLSSTGILTRVAVITRKLKINFIKGD